VSATTRLEPLPAAFYERPQHEVAADLLGMVLVRDSPVGTVEALIVETEAYGGPEDLASHARAGKTARTEPMFGAVGRAYVYLVYGMHHCLNVVAHAHGAAGAVLIRAALPLAGVDLVAARRSGSRRGARGTTARLTRLVPERAAAGPALVCQALDVDRSFTGADLIRGEALRLGRPPAAELAMVRGAGVVTGPRVGVDYAGDEWASRPWRFGLRGHPALSRPFRAS
jgi:DNA-3-methyladenine glycosylase